MNQTLTFLNFSIPMIWLYDLFGILAAFLFVWIMFRLFVRWLKRLLARRRHKLDREEMHRRWNKIQGFLNSSETEMQTLAVIEADKMLDFVLKAMQMPGDGLSRRLAYASTKYYELKRVRWAHRLRNQLVHEEISLKRSQAVAAVHEFERALKLLGAL